MTPAELKKLIDGRDEGLRESSLAAHPPQQERQFPSTREEIQTRMREHNDKIGFDTDTGKWRRGQRTPKATYRTTPAQHSSWLNRQHRGVEGEPKWFKKDFNALVPEHTEKEPQDAFMAVSRRMTPKAA